MKRITLLATAVAVLFCLSGLPLMAQGRGGGVAPPGGGGMGNPGMGNPGIGNSLPMVVQKTPSQLLAQNAKLSSKLQPLLPAGTKPQDAASGFDDLEEFVTALHVSHNLGIPFDQLKTKMIAGDSLGKAIHRLNPDLSHKDLKAAVKTAKKEAKDDIKSSNS